jgi:RHS repeat-associated protein
VFPDHLGTPRVIRDAQGGLVAHHYTPFGEEYSPANGDGTRMKFTGHERDANHPTSTADDLDYMHARFYNPLLGRFLSTDAVVGEARRPQSLNRYGYALNNPLSLVDPDGLQPSHPAQVDPDGPIGRRLEAATIIFGLLSVKGNPVALGGLAATGGPFAWILYDDARYQETGNDLAAEKDVASLMQLALSPALSAADQPTIAEVFESWRSDSGAADPGGTKRIEGVLSHTDALLAANAQSATSFHDALAKVNSDSALPDREKSAYRKAILVELNRLKEEAERLRRLKRLSENALRARQATDGGR